MSEELKYDVFYKCRKCEFVFLHKTEKFLDSQLKGLANYEPKIVLHRCTFQHDHQFGIADIIGFEQV